MTNEPKAGGGIDPEMLAAYIDKRLPPDERAAVEAQLATDPDSYELLVELIHANEALTDELPQVEGEPQPSEREEPQARTGAVVPLVPKPARTRTWVIAGGVLAVAAALVLVVRLPGMIEGLGGGSRPLAPEMERLRSAVEGSRRTEGRLTGGFEYSPRRTLRGLPGASVPPRDWMIVAEVQELEQLGPRRNPSQSHALGIGYLLLGRHAEAAATLKALVAGSPQDAAYLSDYATALLESATSNRDALPEALAAARRAVSLAPSMPEALFALAAILERLGDEGAAAAWQAYLDVDSTSGWAEEARARSSKASQP